MDFCAAKEQYKITKGVMVCVIESYRAHVIYEIPCCLGINRRCEFSTVLKAKMVLLDLQPSCSLEQKQSWLVNATHKEATAEPKLCRASLGEGGVSP